MTTKPRAAFYEVRDLFLSSPNEAVARIKKDRRLLDARSGLGETLLHWMAVENVIPAVTSLIELGSAIDTENNFGSTPLQEAVQLGRTEICLALLDSGASVTHTNEAGDTVISSATILKRHTQLVGALLARLPADTLLSDVLDEFTIEGLRHRDDQVAELFRLRGLPESTSYGYAEAD